MTVEWRRGDYRISMDPSLLSLDAVESLLGTSYWAADRLRETIQKSIRHSLCYGLYCGERQVGFARAVTESRDVLLALRRRGRRGPSGTRSWQGARGVRGEHPRA
jgi:hypothetical protein